MESRVANLNLYIKVNSRTARGVVSSWRSLNAQDRNGATFFFRCKKDLKQFASLIFRSTAVQRTVYTKQRDDGERACERTNTTSLSNQTKQKITTTTTTTNNNNNLINDYAPETLSFASSRLLVSGFLFLLVSSAVPYTYIYIYIYIWTLYMDTIYRSSEGDPIALCWGECDTRPSPDGQENRRAQGMKAQSLRRKEQEVEGEERSTTAASTYPRTKKYDKRQQEGRKDEQKVKQIPYDMPLYRYMSATGSSESKMTRNGGSSNEGRSPIFVEVWWTVSYPPRLLIPITVADRGTRESLSLSLLDEVRAGLAGVSCEAVSCVNKPNWHILLTISFYSFFFLCAISFLIRTTRLR
eukprot:gene5731-4092_t